MFIRYKTNKNPVLNRKTTVNEHKIQQKQRKNQKKVLTFPRLRGMRESNNREPNKIPINAKESVVW